MLLFRSRIQTSGAFRKKERTSEQGIKIHEIYAPESVDKNKDFRDAIKGDYSSLEKQLSAHVEDFVSYVSNRRGEKAKANASAWNTGKMFTAGEAVKLGLADAVMPFQQVISKASWLGKRNKQS